MIAMGSNNPTKLKLNSLIMSYICEVTFIQGAGPPVIDERETTRDCCGNGWNESPITTKMSGWKCY